MASETPYLRAILPSLPSDVAKKIRILCGSPESSAEYVLDTLIRFVSGAECAPESTNDARTQWSEKQQAATKILDDMIRRPSSEPKRLREDDTEAAFQASKRQKSSGESVASLTQVTPDEEIFTIHSVSATSPIRKKVDITICQNSLKLTHSTTHALEATVPLSILTRAFLLPTRGKQKPHWTVVLISTDTTERGKPTNASTQQVIFGLDSMAPSPLTTTTHTSPEPVVNIVPKGSPTLPSIRGFLSKLGIQMLEPTPSVFKSVCTGVTAGVSANEDGVPGIVAYRGAKPGSLWFMEEGILWGESKPCEFWAVEDLIGKSEGLRVVNASGQACSVILTRKSGGEEEVGEDEEDMGVETEFSLINTREKTGIDGWVRAYRHLFGKKKVVGEVGMAAQVFEDSDEEDEDFEMDSDEAGDTSSSSSESSDEDGDGGSGGDPEDSDAEASEGEDEEEELREENHPLMRPGAMPRMNRAVIDMVVGMVQDDMMGTASGGAESDGEDEEDELDD